MHIILLLKVIHVVHKKYCLNVCVSVAKWVLIRYVTSPCINFSYTELNVLIQGAILFCTN